MTKCSCVAYSASTHTHDTCHKTILGDIFFTMATRISIFMWISIEHRFIGILYWRRWIKPCCELSVAGWWSAKQMSQLSAIAQNWPNRCDWSHITCTSTSTHAHHSSGTEKSEFGMTVDLAVIAIGERDQFYGSVNEINAFTTFFNMPRWFCCRCVCCEKCICVRPGWGGRGVGLVIRLVNYAAMHLCLTTTVAVAAASHMWSKQQQRWRRNIRKPIPGRISDLLTQTRSPRSIDLWHKDADWKAVFNGSCELKNKKHKESTSKLICVRVPHHHPSSLLPAARNTGIKHTEIISMTLYEWRNR